MEFGSSYGLKYLVVFAMFILSGVLYEYLPEFYEVPSFTFVICYCSEIDHLKVHDGLCILLLRLF